FPGRLLALPEECNQPHLSPPGRGRHRDESRCRVRGSASFSTPSTSCGRSGYTQFTFRAARPLPALSDTQFRGRATSCTGGPVVNRSSKKQQHEQARKKHKQAAEAHARELAQQKPRTRAAWVLGIGMALVLAVVIAAAVWREMPAAPARATVSRPPGRAPSRSRHGPRPLAPAPA